jgi:pimeloyl-ACP methyl ester carboxylesterase
MNVCEKLVAGLMLGTSLAAQALADSEDSRDRERERPHQVVTIDHFVPHISTVPANSGELVHLFVRERIAGSGLCACSSARQDRAPEEREDDGDKRANREVVLMIHGRSIPVLPVADLGDDDYNWALSLARAGIDVFLMDFQGSGRSPRPKMEDPCNVPIAQQALLIPRPLQNTCTPKYAGRLNTGQSDWDELDRVVDYIRELRGVDKVHLISWSQGSFRAGPYTVQHPEKVASLFFLAPIFNTAFAPAKQPQPTTPMTLRTRAGVFAGDGKVTGWDVEVKCPGQREAGIQDVVWAAIMDNDRLGRTWGPPPAGAPADSAPEGLMRVREALLGAWNSAVAAGAPPDKPGLNVPTLIVRGEFDTGQGGLQHVAELYSLVQNPNKLRFHVQCAGHHMQWEKQRTVLHEISKQWIKRGRVGRDEQGEFVVDADGNISPL